VAEVKYYLQFSEIHLVFFRGQNINLHFAELAVLNGESGFSTGISQWGKLVENSLQTKTLLGFTD
jgi:hypothetical protein